MASQPLANPDGTDARRASSSTLSTLHSNESSSPSDKPAPDNSTGLDRMRTTGTARSTWDGRDIEHELHLPHRTLTTDANMDEYRVEVPSGEIPGPPKGDSGKNYRLVTFEPNDPGNPKNWSLAMKWYCTFVVAITCFVVAFNSSVITADVQAVAAEFGQSVQLTLASISLFVVGFGIGTLSSRPPTILEPELTDGL